MERIRGKLHSRTGASMLIALLFFLVVMTVGVVVLTAASANAGRVKRNRDEQQKYLAVASAAEMVKEDIVGELRAEFEVAYAKEDKECCEESEPDENGIRHIRYWIETTYRAEKAPTIKNSKLLKMAESDLGELYYSIVWNSEIGRPWVGNEPEITPGPMEYSLRFSENTEKNFPEVTGMLKINKEPSDEKNRSRYTIVVTLAAEDGTNAVTMTFPAEVKKKTSSQGGNPTITIYTTTVKWDNPQIIKGAGA